MNYDTILFAPKFPVTYYKELRYITGYEVSKAMVDVRYILKEYGMRYDIYSPAKEIQAHIMLPKNQSCARVTVNDELISFEQVQVRESKYVDFTLTEDTQKVSIEIYFW